MTTLQLYTHSSPYLSIVELNRLPDPRRSNSALPHPRRPPTTPRNTTPLSTSPRARNSKIHRRHCRRRLSVRSHPYRTYDLQHCSRQRRFIGRSTWWCGHTGDAWRYARSRWSWWEQRQGRKGRAAGCAEAWVWRGWTGWAGTGQDCVDDGGFGVCGWGVWC